MSLDQGTWKHVFAACVWKPAIALADMFTADVIWCALWKHKGTIKMKNVLNQKALIHRFQCAIQADLMKCLNENSRFISVALSMKEFSQTLFEVLVEICGSKHELNIESIFQGFLVHFKEKSTNLPATNIGPIIAILQYCYIVDHPYLKKGIVGQPDKIPGTLKELMPETNAEEYEKQMKDQESFMVDGGNNYFNVVNPLKEAVMQIKFKDKKPEPGKEFNLTSSNYGTVINNEWKNNQPRFFWPEMQPEDAVSLAEFAHMIATGGFKSRQDEENNYKKYQVYLDPKFKDPKFLDEVSRRVVGTKNFWKKIEESELFNPEIEKKERKGIQKK